MKQFNNMIFIFSSIISTLFLLTACSKEEIQFQETETYSVLESVTEQVEESELPETEMIERQDVSLEGWGFLTEEVAGKRYAITQNIIYEKPLKTLWKEEALLKAYTEKLFLQLCCAPDRIDYCYNKITQEGTELFKQIEWKCDNSRMTFDYSNTEWGELVDETKITGKTTVESKFLCGTDLTGENDWQVAFSWSYDTETGIFDLQKISQEQKTIGAAKVNVFDKRADMLDKEIILFTEKLFIFLCQHPEYTDNYDKVLNIENMERLQQADWYYEEPDKVYDSAESGGRWEENLYIGRTTVFSHYTFDDIDFGQFKRRENIKNLDYYLEMEEKYSSPAFCWYVAIDWIYDKETGIILINKVEFYPSLSF